MSRDTWNIDCGPMRGFYRDRENGWIFGVCAGVADRYNFSVGMVRVIAVISLALMFWLTAAVYLGLTLLIREKPLVYSGMNSEYEFWRSYRRDHRRHL
jgi:phage shock protein C